MRLLIGQRNFRTLKANAIVLEKMGKKKEADSLMSVALPMATENQVHNYARQLLSQNEIKRATEVYQYNYKNHPIHLLQIWDGTSYECKW
jgi:hypothetical protein